MFETIKNFFIGFFAEEQKTDLDHKNQSILKQEKDSNNHHRNNSNFSTLSTLETDGSSLEKEEEEIKIIINEGKFKKTNFYTKELIKDILNSEKKETKKTKDIKNSITGNGSLKASSRYETHVESYTKEQERLNSYNYRTGK